MKTSKLIETQLSKARGAVKETLGKTSRRDQTRFDREMEHLFNQSREKLLRSEAQALKDIEFAVQKGQQNLRHLSDSLAANADQIVCKPKKRRSFGSFVTNVSRMALLAGLGYAVFTGKIGSFGERQSQDTSGMGYPASSGESFSGLRDAP